MLFTSRLLTFALLALISLTILVLRIDGHVLTKARMGEDDRIRMDSTGIEPQTEGQCLTEALYFEAAYHDSYEGLAAVALVILNRKKDPEFPHTICKVVHQGWPGPRDRCQFSYYCDGKPEVMADPKWKETLSRFAEAFLANPPDDFTDGRKYYFAHQYFIQKGLRLPQWYDCKIFGSQTFCQGTRPPKTQIASR